MSKITNNNFYDSLFSLEKMPKACLLCGDGNLDELGHIIPKLAMRWLKHASKLNSFYFNNTETKMADTPAFRMMCNDCEDKFSCLEKHFTDNYFKRYYRKQPTSTILDELYTFSISVAWRLIVSSEILKTTQKHIREYKEAFSGLEHLARNFLNDHGQKCNIDVYVFSSDEILENLPEDKLDKRHLLYSIRQGLKAHNLYNKNGLFKLSFSRMPIVSFKIGFLYFFVVDSGYFSGVQFDMISIKSSETYNLYKVKYTEGFLGFMNWCFDHGLYEVDISCIPQENYTNRNYY